MYFRPGGFPSYHKNWSVIWEQAAAWKVSALAYGGATIVGFCWLTDWKAVCKYIPYYGGKYKRGSPRRYALE